ncbi:hypothetical protein M0813_16795 [Anaeramoeba flamelloides]|uniref:Ubiquitin-like domain-containing protein n=1 Tax=Anaeramoeba flamelloides TaxID=1746091 RepID=A0AAV7ZRE4_9EUKA|nr:hypothetical protein M0812_12292 [Anaeramoeba flamelloides]KAJ6249721.1 hypothetical protein M0813_16795 [Anaeramoeba flamelloides]
MSSDEDLIELDEIKKPKLQQNPLKAEKKQRSGIIIQANTFTLHVRCVTINPKKKQKTIEIKGNIRIQDTDDITRIEEEFLKLHPEILTRDFFVLHKNLLFKTGTIKECGIEEGSNVELYNAVDRTISNANEGYTCIFWSSMFLILGLILFVSAWSYDFGEDVVGRALLSVFGFVISLSSLIVFTMGICQAKICGHSSFSGHKWR